MDDFDISDFGSVCQDCRTVTSSGNTCKDCGRPFDRACSVIELLATGDLRAYVEMSDAEDTELAVDSFGKTIEECLCALQSRILSAMEEAAD